MLIEGTLLALERDAVPEGTVLAAHALCEAAAARRPIRLEIGGRRATLAQVDAARTRLQGELDSIDALVEATLGQEETLSVGIGGGKPHPRVVHLQNRLNALGHRVAADGKFGEVTHEAVKDFQAKAGMQPTGDVDPDTHAALRHGRVVTMMGDPSMMPQGPPEKPLKDVGDGDPNKETASDAKPPVPLSKKLKALFGLVQGLEGLQEAEFTEERQVRLDAARADLEEAGVFDSAGHPRTRDGEWAKGVTVNHHFNRSDVEGDFGHLGHVINLFPAGVGFNAFNGDGKYLSHHNGRTGAIKAVVAHGHDMTPEGTSRGEVAEAWSPAARAAALVSRHSHDSDRGLKQRVAGRDEQVMSHLRKHFGWGGSSPLGFTLDSVAKDTGVMREHLDDMADRGLVEPVSSDSPIYRVPRTDKALKALQTHSFQRGLARMGGLSESAQTAALSVTHAPIGKGGTNWITKSKPGNTGQLPAYIQNVRNAIMRDGKSESEAHAIAIGRIEDWAEGKGGVSDEVKAASAKAIAELHAMGGASKAKTAAKKLSEADARADHPEHDLPGMVRCPTCGASAPADADACPRGHALAGARKLMHAMTESEAFLRDVELLLRECVELKETWEEFDAMRNSGHWGKNVKSGPMPGTWQDSPGRGPTGKLRNFTSMSAPKLAATLDALKVHGEDHEAHMAAIHAAGTKLGMQVRAKSNVPEKAPVHTLLDETAILECKTCGAPAPAGTLICQRGHRLEEAIGTIDKGAFHRWLGKPEDAPITDADITKGLAAGGHPAKMANFAKNARGWHH